MDCPNPGRDLWGMCGRAELFLLPWFFPAISFTQYLMGSRLSADKAALLGAIENVFGDASQAERATAALKKFLLGLWTKDQLVSAVSEADLDPSKFNSLVLRIASLVFSAQKPKQGTQSSNRQRKKECLRIRGALSEAFLLEMKKEVEDPSYAPKALQQYSIFRRTPEELSSGINEKPQLISLFSASHNILCSKIQGILSVKDMQNKLRKSAFEYKLSEHVPVEVAMCLHECVKHYLKEVVGSSLDARMQKIRKQKLVKDMYGNIQGAYLLYNTYPT